MSKTLSWLLRHSALKEKLNISTEGFLSVHELLRHPQLKNVTVTDIKRVVENNDKQRFTLRLNNGVLEIRANQGHSLTVKDLELTPVDAREVPVVIHGTYLKFWPGIREKGLSRMNRNHIHFSDKIDRNIRKDANLYIYINVARAIASGLKFFRSSNGVILSPGDENGIIKTGFFQEVHGRDGSEVKF